MLEMGKKESTNEKIIRLFKSGMPLDQIATETTMLEENVRNIIASRIPDWENYTPNENSTENSKNSSSGGFLGIFGKKPKVNVTMSKDGFVSDQARAIAEMLYVGRTTEEIQGVFSVSEYDIHLVEENKDMHFKRYFLTHPEKEEELRKENSNKSKKNQKDDGEEEEISVVRQNNRPTSLPIPNIKERPSGINVTIEQSTDKKEEPEEEPEVEDIAEEESLEDEVEIPEEEDFEEEIEEESDVVDMNVTGKSNAFSKISLFIDAQIAEDEKELSKLNEEISSKQDEVEKFDEEIKTYLDKKLELESQIEEISKHLETVNQKITNIESSKSSINEELKDMLLKREGISKEIKDYNNMKVKV